MSDPARLAGPALLLAAFACGVVCGFVWRGLLPAPVAGQNTLFSVDDNGRLTRVAGRPTVPCPSQADGDVVILAIGQSNAANAVGERTRSRHPGRVFSYFAGRCQEAVSPLLGASGIGGEIWSEVGNRLVEKGVGRVVIMPMAVAATPIELWRGDGKLGRQVVTAVKAAPFRPTVIAWIQGESDWMTGTGADAYRQSFLSLRTALRQAGIDAPIRVGVATLCEDGTRTGWTKGNPIATVQRTLPDGRDVLPGPDTDAAVPVALRMDGCHFSGQGTLVAAGLWADALLPPR